MIDVKHTLDDNEIDKLLEVDENNLDSDLASCASFYYFFSQYALEAEQIYNNAVLAVEFRELELSNKYKNEFDPKSKSDKLTETEIKRMFRGDEKWSTLKREENTCYLNYKKMEKAAKAFDMKSTNCQSISKRQLTLKGMNDNL